MLKNRASNPSTDIHLVKKYKDENPLNRYVCRVETIQTCTPDMFADLNPSPSFLNIDYDRISSPEYCKLYNWCTELDSFKQNQSYCEWGSVSSSITLDLTQHEELYQTLKEYAVQIDSFEWSHVHPTILFQHILEGIENPTIMKTWLNAMKG